jgi:hypothetical protein
MTTTKSFVHQTVTSEPAEDQPQRRSPIRLQRLEVVSLSAIRRDPRLRCRVSMNQSTIATYVERIKAGDHVPALDVFNIEQVYFLVDGWHRYSAALKLGLASIQVRVRQGTWQEAIRFALQANWRHGLQLSNRGKRRMVEIAVRELPGESDQTIADCCKVRDTFVAKVRSQLATVANCGKRTRRDGRARKLPAKRSMRQAAG